MKVFSNTVDAFLYGGTLKSVTELKAFWAKMVIIAVVRDEVKRIMLLANKLGTEMFDIKSDVRV